MFQGQRCTCTRPQHCHWPQQQQELHSDMPGVTGAQGLPGPLIGLKEQQSTVFAPHEEGLGLGHLDWAPFNKQQHSNCFSPPSSPTTALPASYRKPTAPPQVPTSSLTLADALLPQQLCVQDDAISVLLDMRYSSDAAGGMPFSAAEAHSFALQADQLTCWDGLLGDECGFEGGSAEQEDADIKAAAAEDSSLLSWLNGSQDLQQLGLWASGGHGLKQMGALPAENGADKIGPDFMDWTTSGLLTKPTAMGMPSPGDGAAHGTDSPLQDLVQLRMLDDEEAPNVTVKPESEPEAPVVLSASAERVADLVGKVDVAATITAVCPKAGGKAQKGGKGGEGAGDTGSIEEWVASARGTEQGGSNRVAGVVSGGGSEGAGSRAAGGVFQVSSGGGNSGFDGGAGDDGNGSNGRQGAEGGDTRAGRRPNRYASAVDRALAEALPGVMRASPVQSADALMAEANRNVERFSMQLIQDLIDFQLRCIGCTRDEAHNIVEGDLSLLPGFAKPAIEVVLKFSHHMLFLYMKTMNFGTSSLAPGNNFRAAIAVSMDISPLLLERHRRQLKACALEVWSLLHILDPRLDSTAKDVLAEYTGRTRGQVLTWMINWRARHRKDIVERIRANMSVEDD